MFIENDWKTLDSAELYLQCVCVCAVSVFWYQPMLMFAVAVEFCQYLYKGRHLFAFYNVIRVSFQHWHILSPDTSFSLRIFIWKRAAVVSLCIYPLSLFHCVIHLQLHMSSPTHNMLFDIINGLRLTTCLWKERKYMSLQFCVQPFDIRIVSSLHLWYHQFSDIE